MLIDRVNQFNIEKRKSQASAERQFIEGQARTTENELHAMEANVRTFLQNNRSIDQSRLLGFEYDRLQRDVTLRRQIYANVLDALQQARSREVRDTPVITMLEDPRLPAKPEARGTVKRTLFGLSFGALLGIIAALAIGFFRRSQLADTEEAREFVQALRDVTPRRLRHG
jgi:hypothetical protein